MSKNLAILVFALLLAGGLASAFLFVGNDDGDTLVTWAPEEEESTEQETEYDPVTGEALGEPEGRNELPEERPETTPGKTAPIARPAMSVTGRVVDKQGVSIDNAKVTLQFTATAGRWRQGPVRVPKPVTTGRDGRFRFEGKGFTKVRVTLRVRHPDFALVRFRKNFELKGDQQEIDVGEIHVVVGGSLAGSITDLNGNPVVGATVRATPHDPNFRWLSDRNKLFPFVKAQPTGNYNLKHLPPGRYRVDATAPDRLWRSIDNITVSDLQESRVPTIKLGPGFVLSGIVQKPDGSPLAKADVRILRSRSRSGQKRRRTDKNGKFEYEHLPADIYAITVRAKGYLKHVEPDVIVGPRGAPSVTLRMQPGLRIDGMVLDGATGQPLEHFAARVRRIGGLPSNEAEHGAAQIKALQRDLNNLRRSRAKGAEQRSARRRLEAAIQKLRARGMEINRRGQLRGERQPRRPASNRNKNPYAARPGKPHRHEGGRFSFPGLEEGVYVIDLGSDEHQRQRSDRIEMRRGQGPANLTITLQRGLAVAGTVRTTDGEPIAGCRVDLLMVDPKKKPTRRSGWGAVMARFRDNQPSGRPVLRAETDAKGAFRIVPAAPGNYFVSARAKQHARGFSKSFELARDLTDLDLRLGKTGRIEGRVRGIPSNKRDKTTVMVTNLRKQEVVPINADGTFVVEDLQPGNYLVRAFAGSVHNFRRAFYRGLLRQSRDPSQQLSVDVRLAAGQSKKVDVTFTDNPVGTVSGSVMINGSGASGCSVTLSAMPEPGLPAGGRTGRFWARTDQEGNYSIAEVPAGGYWLSMRTPGRKGKEVHKSQVFVTADQVNKQPRIVLSIANLKGQIVAADKARPRSLRGSAQLFPGATTVPKDMKAWRQTHSVYHARIRDGKFTFENVPSGSYLLALRLSGRLPTEQSIYLGAQENGEQSFPAGKRRPRKPRKPRKKPTKVPSKK